MNSGIAEENSLGSMRHQPGHRRVGQRVKPEYGLIPAQVGAQRPVEAQQGACGQPPLPEVLAVFEAGEEEVGAAFRFAKGVQRPPVETRPRRRQVGTGRQVRGHARFVAAKPACVNGAARLFAWRARKFRRQPPRLNPASNQPPAAGAPDRTVNAITGWRRVLLWPFGLIVRLWGRTLRMEAAPEDLQRYMKKDVPVAIVLWHNRLFLAAEIVRRYRQGRPAYALVSASQDGAWLTAFFALAGLGTVRGSSSRMGREAATALVNVLRQGDDVGITPDGPRGPCYDVKPGAVIVARRTGAPLLLVGAEFGRAWRLGSWDRFYLPLPFSRVRMRCEVIEVGQLADRDAGTARLRERLLAINPD